MSAPTTTDAASTPASRGTDAGAGPAMIETRALTKRYGTLTAVDGLDLTVMSGEIYGLLGPNGAGKTTTILMLLGLSDPTSGIARVLGLDPARDPRAIKRRVGYLPDNAGFYGSMTGRENLRYTARLNALSGRLAEDRIDGVLDLVGLTDRANDRAETYSRGMRQRLGIADALVKGPQVLILDEPTTAIDPIGVTEILDLIRTLARDEGLAILLASHLLDQVQAVCHRVGIFHEGRLIAEGTVDEIAQEFGDGGDRIEIGIDRADSSFEGQVAGLLGEVPGVTAVDSVPSGHGGPEVWRLTFADDVDRRIVGQAVVLRVLDAGLRLDRFGRARPSLERIYKLAVARATDEEADAGAPASTARDVA